MFKIRANAVIELVYTFPAKTPSEQYHRAHVKNVLNRIAYRFFDDPDEADRLRKRINTELLLEGQSLPEHLEIIGK